jgi:hypothetical protein
MAKENWQILEDVRYWLSEAARLMVYHKRDGYENSGDIRWRFERAKQALDCLTNHEQEKFIDALPQMPGHKEMWLDPKAKEVPSMQSLLLSPSLSRWEKLGVEELQWLSTNLFI